MGWIQVSFHHDPAAGSNAHLLESSPDLSEKKAYRGAGSHPKIPHQARQLTRTTRSSAWLRGRFGNEAGLEPSRSVVDQILDDPVGAATHVSFVVEPIDLIHQRDRHHYCSSEKSPFPVEFLVALVRERPLEFLLKRPQRIAEVFFHQLMVGEVRFHPQPGEEFEEIGASLVGIVAEPNERLDVRLDDIVHARGWPPASRAY